MNWIEWTALVVSCLVVAVAALAAFGSWRWDGATTAQMALLDANRAPAPAGLHQTYDACEIVGLPAPVQRYFRAVLKDG